MKSKAKIFPLCAVLFWLPTIATAQNADLTASGWQPTETCEYYGPQQQLNECGSKHLDEVNAELQKLVAIYVAQLTQERFREGFRRSQTVWLEYREADCGYWASFMEGGSGWGLTKMLCEIDSTLTRIRRLESFISCTQNGCPE